jgi:hypothetical protein
MADLFDDVFVFGDCEFEIQTIANEHKLFNFLPDGFIKSFIEG